MHKWMMTIVVFRILREIAWTNSKITTCNRRMQPSHAHKSKHVFWCHPSSWTMQMKACRLWPKIPGRTYRSIMKWTVVMLLTDFKLSIYRTTLLNIYSIHTRTISKVTFINPRYHQLDAQDYKLIITTIQLTFTWSLVAHFCLLIQLHTIHHTIQKDTKTIIPFLLVIFSICACQESQSLVLEKPVPSIQANNSLSLTYTLCKERWSRKRTTTVCA